MTQVFVIRPTGAKRDPSGRKIDFDRVQKELIGPVLESAQLGGVVTGDLVDAGHIRDEIGVALLAADLVICDVTLQDANVFYELGVRHALRRHRTLLIKGQPTDDAHAFEQMGMLSVTYEIGSPAAAKERLLDAVLTAIRGDPRADSPILQMAIDLRESDRAKFSAVPADFGAEVERARLAKTKGWLRLLASEVQDRRFQLPARRLLARVQTELGDWEGARASWEAVHEDAPDPSESNLSLAHIYAHLYRKEQRPEWIERSDQALFRVIKSDKATRTQRVEALTLAGYNQRTRWQRQLDGANELAQQRTVAMSRSLLRSYEYYRDAYYHDLSQYAPGLAAIQMGTVLLDLANDDAWFDAFDSDSDADTYKRQLIEQMQALRHMVPVSLEADLQTMQQDDAKRLWAEIASADVLFLTSEGRDQRVISAYQHAIPVDKPYACEAVRRQLELFAALGVRKDLAEKVIAALASRFTMKSTSAPNKESHARPKQHQVVLLATTYSEHSGKVTLAGLGGEGHVRTLLTDTLGRMVNEADSVTLYATANPGVDLIAHEVADELGITHFLCLPEHKDDFTARVFGAMEDWRTRLSELSRDTPVLELNFDLGLPRWLQGSDVDPGERYCRWLLHLALAHEADQTSLLVFGDDKTHGRHDLDIVQLQQLAREYGTIEILQLHGQASTKQIA